MPNKNTTRLMAEIRRINGALLATILVEWDYPTREIVIRMTGLEVRMREAIFSEVTFPESWIRSMLPEWSHSTAKQLYRAWAGPDAASTYTVDMDLRDTEITPHEMLLVQLKCMNKGRPRDQTLAWDRVCNGVLFRHPEHGKACERFVGESDFDGSRSRKAREGLPRWVHEDFNRLAGAYNGWTEAKDVTLDRPISKLSIPRFRALMVRGCSLLPATMCSGPLTLNVGAYVEGRELRLTAHDGQRTIGSCYSLDYIQERDGHVSSRRAWKWSGITPAGIVRKIIWLGLEGDIPMRPRDKPLKVIAREAALAFSIAQLDMFPPMAGACHWLAVGVLCATHGMTGGDPHDHAQRHTVGEYPEIMEQVPGNGMAQLRYAEIRRRLDERADTPAVLYADHGWDDY